MIQYLAKCLGHKCIRINNHEHTDLQEYVGMYTANTQGQLVFQEGLCNYITVVSLLIICFCCLYLCYKRKHTVYI